MAAPWIMCQSLAAINKKRTPLGVPLDSHGVGVLAPALYVSWVVAVSAIVEGDAFGLVVSDDVLAVRHEVGAVFRRGKSPIGSVFVLVCRPLGMTVQAFSGKSDSLDCVSAFGEVVSVLGRGLADIPFKFFAITHTPVLV